MRCFRGDANIDCPTSRFGPIQFLIGEVNNLNLATAHAIQALHLPFSHIHLSFHACQNENRELGQVTGISKASEILAPAGLPSL